jgi:predicted nucleic acid-binding protein
VAAKPTHSVDSCSLLAYLRGEEGAEEVRSLLDDPENHIAVHRLVLAELFGDFCRVDGADVAEAAWGHVESTFHLAGDISNQFLKRAAHWRMELKSSYALAIAAALAEEHGATLIVHPQTPGQETLAQEGLELLRVGEPPGSRAVVGPGDTPGSPDGHVSVEPADAVEPSPAPTEGPAKEEPPGPLPMELGLDSK